MYKIRLGHERDFFWHYGAATPKKTLFAHKVAQNVSGTRQRFRITSTTNRTSGTRKFCIQAKIGLFTELTRSTRTARSTSRTRTLPSSFERRA